jgi:hypothetical protein
MRTTQTLQKVGRVAADACSTAAQASRQAVSRGVRYLGQNPVRTIVGAVALGLLAAWAFRRRPLDIEIKG